jgi:hypothetical protein
MDGKDDSHLEANYDWSGTSMKNKSGAKREKKVAWALTTEDGEGGTRLSLPIGCFEKGD